MKQNITIEQLNELSEEEKSKLEKYLKNKWKENHYGYDYIPKMPIQAFFMSIGDMIEFLDEHTKDQPHFSIRMGRATDGFAFPEGTLITHMDGVPIEIEDEPILCDALWEVTKELLEANRA